MDYVVNGGNCLYGEVPVYGAKNCALACIAAALLTEEEVVLNNCPDIADVANMLLAVQSLGKKVVRQGDVVCISGKAINTQVPSEIACLLRGSTLLLGSLVGMYGNATLPLTGGCAIGKRPIDIHLDGLHAMGVQTEQFADKVVCNGTAVGTNFFLRFASVGATENLVCAATLAKGETVLDNCAVEPEVVALCNMLVAMGAKIKGIGRSRLVVSGVDKLHGACFDVIPDRIVVATYLSAVVVCGGQVSVVGCPSRYLTSFLQTVCGSCKVFAYDNAVTVSSFGRNKGLGTLSTAPYPAFCTDMQSLALSVAASAKGKSVIVENLFENRLCHNASQLNKMGGCVKVVGNKAFVVGKKLHGASVVSADLRGGAALIVAGLCAQGQAVVVDSGNCIARGYQDVVGALSSLGADVSVGR